MPVTHLNGLFESNFKVVEDTDNTHNLQLDSAEHLFKLSELYGKQSIESRLNAIPLYMFHNKTFDSGSGSSSSFCKIIKFIPNMPHKIDIVYELLFSDNKEDNLQAIQYFNDDLKCICAQLNKIPSVNYKFVKLDYVDDTDEICELLEKAVGPGCRLIQLKGNVDENIRCKLVINTLADVVTKNIDSLTLDEIHDSKSELVATSDNLASNTICNTSHLKLEQEYSLLLENLTEQKVRSSLKVEPESVVLQPSTSDKYSLSDILSKAFSRSGADKSVTDNKAIGENYSNYVAQIWNVYSQYIFQYARRPPHSHNFGYGNTWIEDTQIKEWIYFFNLNSNKCHVDIIYSVIFGSEGINLVKQHINNHLYDMHKQCTDLGLESRSRVQQISEKEIRYQFRIEEAEEI